MNNSELQALADMISANVTLNHKEVLTADEAARYMGVSKSYLYKLTMQGKVPFSKPLGKMCYFNRLELEAWLMSNRQSTIDEISDKAQAYCATHTRTTSKKGGKS
jgi:excisionase family DNA binding protein